MVLIILLTFSMLGLGLISQSGENLVDAGKRRQALQAFWSAEGAVTEATARLVKDDAFSAAPAPLSGTLGRVDYAVDTVRFGNRYTLAAVGTNTTWHREIVTEVELIDVTWHPTILDFAAYGDAGFHQLLSDAVVYGDVFQAGNISATGGAAIRGGLAYATGTATGDLVPGNPATLVPFPAMPGLDTTPYDVELLNASIFGGPTLSGDVNLGGGTVYVNGSVVSSRIFGPGRLVATGNVVLHTAPTLDPDVTVVAGGDLSLIGATTLGTNCLFYANGAALARATGQVASSCAILGRGTITLRDTSRILGMVYSLNRIEMIARGSIIGSAVAGHGFTLSSESQVTHDAFSLPARIPPGLEVIGENNLLDDFNAAAFDGNDGSSAWNAAWEEVGVEELATGPGPTDGRVQVVPHPLTGAGFALRIGLADGDLLGSGILREADTAGADEVTLEFVRRTDGRDDGLSTANVALDISLNGGASWTTIRTYPLNWTTEGLVFEQFDLTPFASAAMRIRFAGTGTTHPMGDHFYADHVKVITRTGSTKMATTLAWQEQ